MTILTAQEKAMIDFALERGTNPSELEGSFAWASLIPFLPLLQPVLNPITKLIDRGTEKLFSKIGLGPSKPAAQEVGKGFTPTGRGFAPSGANGVTGRHTVFYGRGHNIPMKTRVLKGSGVAGNERLLEILKKKLMPYTKNPVMFREKLTEMLQKGKELSQMASTASAASKERSDVEKKF